jgi:hypothetical protein
VDIVVTCPAIVVGTYPVERLSRARIDLRFPQSASEGRLFPLFIGQKYGTVSINIKAEWQISGGMGAMTFIPPLNS